MEQSKKHSLRLLHKTPSKYTSQKGTTYLYYEPGVSPTSLQGCIEILEQAHNMNKPTRALKVLNTQKASTSINGHKTNKLQSALQQLDI